MRSAWTLGRTVPAYRSALRRTPPETQAQVGGCVARYYVPRMPLHAQRKAGSRRRAVDRPRSCRLPPRPDDDPPRPALDAPDREAELAQDRISPGRNWLRAAPPGTQAGRVMPVGESGHRVRMDFAGPQPRRSGGSCAPATPGSPDCHRAAKARRFISREAAGRNYRTAVCRGRRMLLATPARDRHDEDA